METEQKPKSSSGQHPETEADTTIESRETDTASAFDFHFEDEMPDDAPASSEETQTQAESRTGAAADGSPAAAVFGKLLRPIQEKRRLEKEKEEKRRAILEKIRSEHDAEADGDSLTENAGDHDRTGTLQNDERTPASAVPVSARAERRRAREERRRREVRRQKLLIAAVAAVAVFFILLIANRYHVLITLNGDAEVTAEYGETYDDPGAKALYKGSIFGFRNRELTVETDNPVDTDAIGDYTVTYTASYKKRSGEATRTVHVADTEPPVISLETDEDAYTLPGHEYEEEGYTAEDNYDGDLTDSVTTEERDGIVYYTVTDSNGNTGHAERKIVYRDPDAPVITLDASANEVQVGSDWEDSYSAYDEADGDVTDKVQVDGSVDTDTPGTYTLTYTVSDSAGNEATAERTVEVVEELSDEVTGPKIVFLTFDDGPGQYTDRVLDILAKYNVKATFFVTDQFPEYEDEIAREYNEGHAVGVHSYTHDFETCYTTDDGYWEDFDKMNDIIEEQTGQRADIFRFPGGSSNTVSETYNEKDGIMTRLTEEAAEKGYDYFDWNVSSGDAGKTTDSEVVYENVTSQLADHDVSVVLVHDIHEYTVDALEDIITYGLENGYTFMPLKKGIYTCHHKVNN